MAAPPLGTLPMAAASVSESRSSSADVTPVTARLDAGTCTISIDMKFHTIRVWFVLGIVTLWALTPALACALQTASLTPAERECCKQMAGNCDRTIMPAGHACCRPPANHNASLNPGQADLLVRQFSAAIAPAVQHAPAVPETKHPMFVDQHAPPHDIYPACSSILRI